MDRCGGVPGAGRSAHVGRLMRCGAHRRWRRSASSSRGSRNGTAREPGARWPGLGRASSGRRGRAACLLWRVELDASQWRLDETCHLRSDVSVNVKRARRGATELGAKLRVQRPRVGLHLG